MNTWKWSKPSANRDLTPGDLRRSWCGDQRNKVHSKSNALESSKTTPATLSTGETAVHTSVPGAKKSGDCCSQEHTLRDSESVYKTGFKCFLKTALQSKKMKKKISKNPNNHEDWAKYKRKIKCFSKLNIWLVAKVIWPLVRLLQKPSWMERWSELESGKPGSIFTSNKKSMQGVVHRPASAASPGDF